MDPTGLHGDARVSGWRVPRWKPSALSSAEALGKAAPSPSASDCETRVRGWQPAARPSSDPDPTSAWACCEQNTALRRKARTTALPLQASGEGSLVTCTSCVLSRETQRHHTHARGLGTHRCGDTRRGGSMMAMAGGAGSHAGGRSHSAPKSFLSVLETARVTESLLSVS